MPKCAKDFVRYRTYYNTQRPHSSFRYKPPKRNRKTKIVFSPYLYKARNEVVRFFNKLKYFRRISTRYDKLGSTV